MSDEDQKKPKIDLKARLGKKTVAGAAGASIPPPMMTPGASIPAPPFTPSRAPAPASTPFSEPPPRIEPQAIKIEMGEEVLEAQKKGRTKWMLVAAGTALVGGVLGFAVGGGAERSKNYDNAMNGAGILAEDVDKASVEIEKLVGILKKANAQLSDGKFPEAEVNELGAVNIPFDGTYLAGKGIGLMSSDINRLLVKFAGDAEAANDQKDKLKRVLSGMKPQVTEFLDERDPAKAKVRWSVYVGSSPQGPIASMQPVPTPFLVTSKEAGFAWPANIEVKDGDKTTKLDRYTKGDPVSSSPLIIPVDPATQTAVCPSDTLSRLSKELGGLQTILNGDKSDPTNEKLGLIDTATALREKLKGVGS